MGAFAAFLVCLFAGGPAAAAPPHDQMLRQLIGDAAWGHVAYETLSPGLAEAVRPQAAVAQAELSALGYFGVGDPAEQGQGRDGDLSHCLRTRRASNGPSTDEQGLIDNAIYRPAKADPH